MAEGASRNAGLLRRFSTRLRTVWITAGIGHTTDAKEPKWLTDRLLSGDAELPLWVDSCLSRQSVTFPAGQPAKLTRTAEFGQERT